MQFNSQLNSFPCYFKCYVWSVIYSTSHMMQHLPVAGTFFYTIRKSREIFHYLPQIFIKYFLNIVNHHT